MALRRLCLRSIVVAMIACGWGIAAAQDAQPEGKTTTSKPSGRDVGLPPAVPGDQVVIKRDAAAPVDPQRFRTPLYLVPSKTVTLVAPYDAIVRAVSLKTGEHRPVQTEVARLDNTVQKFQLQRAQSLHKAAVLEQKLSADAAGDRKELIQAKVDAAKAEVDLAQHLLDQSQLRLPFAGEVLRLIASEGQFVRAGDPVAIVGDTAQMQVEIPVERSQIAGAKTFAIKVESEETEARVESVLPLNPKFDALRELFDSLTSAVLVLDNPQRQYQPGQTVIVPLIPRHPVVEVANGAIANRSDGGRKVQVLRDSIVRDIPITLMGSVGADRSFVSGPFAAGDEVIYETSHLLADGFPVRPGTGMKKPSDDAGAKKPAAKPAQTGF
jgi:multidrug efflux pump subunit AcrA (membrane-fusion protein)